MNQTIKSHLWILLHTCASFVQLHYSHNSNKSVSFCCRCCFFFFIAPSFALEMPIVVNVHYKNKHHIETRECNWWTMKHTHSHRSHYTQCMYVCVSFILSARPCFLTLISLFSLLISFSVVRLAALPAVPLLLFSFSFLFGCYFICSASHTRLREPFVFYLQNMHLNWCQPSHSRPHFILHTITANTRARRVISILLWEIAIYESIFSWKFAHFECISSSFELNGVFRWTHLKCCSGLANEENYATTERKCSSKNTHLSLW